MKQLLLRWLRISIVLVTVPVVANAQGGKSGNEFLPACKAFVALKELSPASAFMVGACAGQIDALLSVASGLHDDMRFCAPPEVTGGQAARVVVNYMERTPELLHLPFGVLAIKAFRLSWPCK
jgi:hypothetical protein